MSRLHTLLATLILTAVCTLLPASAMAGGSTRQSTGGSSATSASATPTAHTARTTSAQSHIGRAHSACKVGTRHRKHRHGCTVRAHAPHKQTVRAGGHAASHSNASAAAKAKTRHRDHSKRGDKAGTTVTVGSSSASAIAKMLATPCQNTELMPEAGNLEQIKSATLCLVNQERARDNELPLTPNAQLEQSSQMHSNDMIGEDYFAHIAPNGETPLQRIQATGYIPNAQVGYTIGENIAWGTLSLATPSAIVSAWIASPEHLANILNAEYRDTAIGIDPAAPTSLGEGQPGAVYTQEFGVIIG